MNKKITFDDIVKKFNLLLEESMRMIIFVRDIELQKAQVSILATRVQEIRNYKYQAIEHNDEETANIFFAFHNLLNSVKSCIESIIYLKENNHLKSWHKIIDAEEFLDYAALQQRKLYGLEEYNNHLKNMQKCLFPKFDFYNSPGLEETIGNCNICEAEYGTCNHIEGLLYSGIVCQRINRKIIDVNHTALVKNPKDKRCIITEISTDDGYMKDYMTLKVLDKKIKNTNNDEGMNLNCILMIKNELEIN
ncbi:hypothetical protein AAW30_01827 [Arcobacter porcinus]|uniref:hypothetical protein n=1 Tax=Arcobacter porcinus TaxID=1935204 RepID=UPI00082420FD|nr:hypothetical protein [Arcobacter porcinus]OCL81611.1 hypothetical protein AAW30_01827 [Arcobacter porcinus]